MNHLFITSLSKAINAYLKLDSESTGRLEKLSGRAISIELLPFHFQFQCLFTDQGVKIHTGDEMETETQIRGTPLQMMGVMMAKENRQRFFADDLVMEGDAELGQQVIALFDELQIEWEEQLSKLVGDVPSYHVGRLIRKVGNWFKQTEDSIADDINEYVHEEAQWLPSKEALQDLFHDIDAVRMDVDRAEARIQALANSISKKD